MKTTWIEIDGAFPKNGTEKMSLLIEKGWSILDKTVINNRYIHYLMIDKVDPDVGKCSDSPSK